MDIGWNFECIDFLREIAKGFNPITGEKLSGADILRASDVVGRLEDLVRELEKDYFSLLSFVNSDRSCENVKPLSESIEVQEGLTISQIAGNINKALPLGKTKITKKLTKFLLNEGYLEGVIQPHEKTSTKLATKKGQNLGIVNTLRKYENGTERSIATYSLVAQKFIFENLSKILND